MTQATFSVTPIKAFNDNYIWAINDNASRDIALVDPGDATVCLNYIRQQQKVLRTLLITHHHRDHTGGIRELLQYCRQSGQDCTVYGPATEAIADIDVPLCEPAQIHLFNHSVRFDVLDVPGHTAGHIAYVNEHALFCGDTLFSGGCGRLFEGSPQQMHASLCKLSALSPTTAVYCAHEYTQANLQFALSVDGNNKTLKDYYRQVEQMRKQGLATIPSTIGQEREINPFLRCQQPALIASAQQHSADALNDDAEVFAILRRLKDNF